MRVIKAAEAMNMTPEQFVNMVLTPRGSLAKDAALFQLGVLDPLADFLGERMPKRSRRARAL